RFSCAISGSMRFHSAMADLFATCHVRNFAAGETIFNGFCQPLLSSLAGELLHQQPTTSTSMP
ncbi:hypothetical protein, partial [Xanthomonas fragariae]|uniref:hypothetical protein n=1 Tax=Xanthomonas fragariae TaxID=48664 RepID=UPI003530BAAA